MKYILDNEGNRRHFKRCLDFNVKHPDRKFSLTVNVWRRPTRWYIFNREKVLDSYDAAFHVGEYKTLGMRSPVEARAQFRDKGWIRHVAYRIRIYPHLSTRGDRPSPPRR